MIKSLAGAIRIFNADRKRVPTSPPQRSGEVEEVVIGVVNKHDAPLGWHLGIIFAFGGERRSRHILLCKPKLRFANSVQQRRESSSADQRNWPGAYCVSAF